MYSLWFTNYFKFPVFSCQCTVPPTLSTVSSAHCPLCLVHTVHCVQCTLSIVSSAHCPVSRWLSECAHPITAHNTTLSFIGKSQQGITLHTLPSGLTLYCESGFILHCCFTLHCGVTMHCSVTLHCTAVWLLSAEGMSPHLSQHSIHCGGEYEDYC